jgi:GTP 3',8-cyclase
VFDPFDRRIDYLRISVTDKCNLRCVYCMPEEGIPLIRHEDVLRFEEIAEVARTAVDLGIRKVRLTGGEPLVRRDISTLVAMLHRIDGIADLAMTTNGVRLAEWAHSLAEAGLQRVNVSLDAIDPTRYAAITRGGEVQAVFAGIRAAREAGLEPVKLNCVIQQSPDEPDARDVAAYAKAEGLELRFIRRMNLAEGEFSMVLGGSGGDCARCNRLRLSSNGMLRPCLFSDIEFSVRELGPREAILRAVRNKPACGKTSNNHFYAIGG